MGFFRQQQKQIAMRLLTWQYKRNGRPVPAQIDLEKQAEALVTEAHQIARARGRNVMAILKEMVDDLMKKSS